MAAEAEKKEETGKAQKQTNCLACNKPIKRLRRYYRNGKYFCTKRCFKNSKDQSKQGDA